MYSKLDNNYILRFKQQLNQDNLSNLSSILHEHKAVIAGSYVLQSICEASWANDIDIWCVNPDVDRMLKSFYDLGYGISNFRDVNTRDGVKQKKLAILNNILNDEDDLMTPEYKKEVENLKEKVKIELIEDEIITKMETYKRLQNCIKSIYFLKSENKPPIQIIICLNDIFECINSFDFDICQIYFDSEDIYVKDIKAIKNKRAMITKEASEIQSPIEWIRTLKRAIKYSERGFFIDFSDVRDFIKNIAKVNENFVFEWNTTLYSKKKLYLFPTQKLQKTILKHEPILVMKNMSLPYFYLYTKADNSITFGYIDKFLFSTHIDYNLRNNIIFIKYDDDEI